MDRSTTLACGRLRLGLMLLPLLLLPACSTDPVGPPPPSVPLSAVILSPATDTLRVGQTRQFSATAFDTLGAPVANVGFNWSTSDPGVFTVSTSGRVRAVGEGSGLLVAEAGGRSDTATVFVFQDRGWFSQPSSANGANLNGVFFQPDGRSGWAVGDGGKIVASTDAGFTWSVQSSTTSFDLHGVWFTTAVEGWAVGNGGTVLRTTNAGASWTRLLNVGASEGLRDVWFATRDTGWAVGTGGAVVRTFNRGSSWQKINVPTAFTLNSVSFSGTRDGWAVGDNGVIAGTHDRGLTWFIVLPSVTSNSLKAVWRRSEPVAHAAGAVGVVPRTLTTPDSTAWELRNAGASNALEGIAFTSDLNGFAVGFNAGTGGTVLRTLNGGVDWTAQVSNTSFRLNDVYFVDSQRGWAVGESGTIIHTSFAGEP